MINISKVNKYYNMKKSNAIHVLNDISLELPDTGMVAIFGRSGCGKTTLLNVIGGLDKIHDGTITIDGKNIRENTDTLRNREIGYIFQNYNLSNKETCFDNVASALKLCGLDDQKEIETRVMAALENVDMAKYSSRYPNTLSGGQMQRIAIARAIVKNPKIILADEPTGNLDEHNTILIMDLLREISRNHLVILVTHEANLVNLYCDKIIALSDGKIINERDNAIEGSYVARDKNHIYLGELEKEEDKNELINLEYYGKKPSDPIDIKVINYNGKMYLKLNTPKVQILDDSSEIKLQEGVFQTEGTKKEKEYRMKDIPSFEGKNYGHLFNFKDSIKGGFLENFNSKKIGSKVLKVVLALLAFILVFVTARFGVSIHKVMENEEKYSKYIFYVYTPDTQHSKLLYDSIGNSDSGITFTRLVSYNSIGTESLTFNIGKFESSNSDSVGGVSIDLFKLSLDMIGDKRVVAGKASDLEKGEIVITTKIADKIIEEANNGYIKKYKDIIGFSTSSGYNNLFLYLEDYGIERSNYKVVGIVESNEFEIYLTDIDLALALNSNGYYYDNVMLASQYNINVDDNKVVFVSFIDEGGKAEYGLTTGDTVKINGKDYTISQIISPDEADYRLYNCFLLSDNNYKDRYKYFGASSDFIGQPSGYFYDNYYTLVYSNNVEKTKSFLSDNFSDVQIEEVSYYNSDYKIIYTPELMRENVYDASRESIITNLVTLGIFAILLSVCMYFIMHSMMISRIKEIGIYRAIGVTKKNLIFKFWIEVLVLTTLTILIGYLIASGLIGVWTIKAAAIKDVLYYPLWIALIVIVFLYGISSLCGLIPILMLLRRTPSEILSKYDI